MISRSHSLGSERLDGHYVDKTGAVRGKKLVRVGADEEGPLAVPELVTKDMGQVDSQRCLDVLRNLEVCILFPQ